MYVATIVCDRQKRNLVRELANVPNGSQVQILEEGVAADVYFEKGKMKPGDYDMIVQEVKGRRKELLVCDMESTIIENEFLDEIAELGGFKTEVAKITERAMNGEIGFREAIDERVKIISGMPESEIRALLYSRLRYNPGAKELIAACKREGVYTMLVSGGFTLFTDHVANELGFDEVHANTLTFDQHGFLNGVKHPILGKEAKLEIMTAQANKMGITLNDCAATGDGANDLPMLHAAGLGIAYMAKPKVKAEIKNQINVSDLRTIGYAIGINPDYLK